MAREFVVKFHLAVDAETGEEFILPGEREFREMAKQIDLDEEYAEQLARTGAKEEKERGKVQKAVCQRRRFDLEVLRRTCAGLIPAAEAREYTLVKPGYGKYTEAEGEASGPDENGNAVLNQSRLMKQLLPDCIRGLKREEALELEPAVMLHLWNRLYRALFPDPTRLPFCALPSQTG